MLNIGGNGNIKPFTKFNAKSDKWFLRTDDGDQEIARPTFVADFPNIVTGWLRFREGQAPERLMDPSLNRAAPSPGDGFKRGFVLTVFSPKFFGGVAEFSSASSHVGTAIREVYQIYDDDRDKHPGQVPVISCTGSEAMKDKHGVNYKPVLQLVNWVDRPDDLPDECPVEPSEIWQGGTQPVPSQATHVPPPTAAKPTSDPTLETEF